MIVLFVIISIKILTLSFIIVSCGNKQDESSPAAGNTLDRNKENENVSKIEVKFSKSVQMMQSNEFPENEKKCEEKAEESVRMTYPTSNRILNQKDSWRILALYLDYIRTLNPDDFIKHRLLDSALAILHDVTGITSQSEYSSDVIALAIIYFLVEFHKIKVNNGSKEKPWYTILCKNVNVEDLEKLRKIMYDEIMQNAKIDDNVNQQKENIVVA